MKITKKWLEGKGACHDGIARFAAQSEKDGGTIVRHLMAEHPKNENRLNWASWLIVRILPRKKMIQYAIFAAEQVLEIFEAERPNDKRPREAIAAAKTVLKKNTAKNRAACAAANAAANAAATGTVTAYAAAYAANAAAYAAAYAAAVNAAAYAAAYAAMKIIILEYGLTLLKGDRS